MGGEFEIPGAVRNQDAVKCTFLVLLGGKCLGEKNVTIRRARRRVADVQGRIVRQREAYIDFDAEAERILREALVAS